MDSQRIKDMITGGFKPFVIHMSDRRKLDVPHPEFVAVGKAVVVVIGKNSRVNTLDAIHITGIEEQLKSKSGR